MEITQSADGGLFDSERSVSRVLDGRRQPLSLGDIKGFADRYVKDGLFDGLVNHYLREAILGYFRGAIPARQLARVMRDLASRYGTTALNQS